MPKFPGARLERACGTRCKSAVRRGLCQSRTFVNCRSSAQRFEQKALEAAVLDSYKLTCGRRACSLSSRLNSSDQSDKPKQRPCRSGLPARISASMAAISRRQRVIHAGSSRPLVAISSNVHPSPSSLAFLPLNVCQRCTITSTYFGSSSRP